MGKCCFLSVSVCLCVLGKRRILGIHHVCNLSAKTDILHFAVSYGIYAECQTLAW